MDKTVSATEFSQAVKDFKIQLTADDVTFIFNQFDRNKDGRLDYDEFLRGVRGEMNSQRRGLAERAFTVLDTNGNGVITIGDIAQTYSAKKHPAVIEGRKTEEQVLSEFLETFETHHNLMSGGKADANVTLEEFIEYYNNVSASIDDDAYFAQVMDSSWNLSGQAATYQQQQEGWTNQRPGTAFTEKAYSFKNLDPYSTSNPNRVDATL